jgi:hypothetical protein
VIVLLHAPAEDGAGDDDRLVGMDVSQHPHQVCDMAGWLATHDATCLQGVSEGPTFGQGVIAREMVGC